MHALDNSGLHKALRKQGCGVGDAVHFSAIQECNNFLVTAYHGLDVRNRSNRRQWCLIARGAERGQIQSFRVANRALKKVLDARLAAIGCVGVGFIAVPAVACESKLCLARIVDTRNKRKAHAGYSLRKIRSPDGGIQVET